MPQLILTGSRTHYFPNGVITLTQGTLLRTFAYESAIPDYQHKVPDASQGRLDLGSGSIKIRTEARTPLLLTSTPQHQFTAGEMTILSTGLPSTGAISKFAFWPTTAPGDPADILVDSQTSATAGGVGQGYGRISATFHPTKDTRFIGVGGKWLNVQSSPQSGVAYRQYTRKVQVEKAHIGGAFPSTYEKARQVNVFVRPERVNLTVEQLLVISGTFTTGATFDGSSNWVQVTPAAGIANVRTRTPLTNLKTGQTYTVQFEVANPNSTEITVQVDWCDSNSTVYTIPAGRRQVVSASGNRGGAAYDSTFRFGDVQSTSVFMVRNPMIEKGSVLLPYFNGSTGPDMVWGGAVNSSESFYYKDRAARYAAIKRILEANTPMGIGIGEPTFGVLPADW